MPQGQSLSVFNYQYLRLLITSPFMVFLLLEIPVGDVFN